MRILVTNDDGIHAEGLACLERIAHALSDDVWVSAPESEQSGVARSLTLSDPLRVRFVDDRKFAVAGTPTDQDFDRATRVLRATWSTAAPGAASSGWWCPSPCRC